MPGTDSLASIHVHAFVSRVPRCDRLYQSLHTSSVLNKAYRLSRMQTKRPVFGIAPCIAVKVNAVDFIHATHDHVAGRVRAMAL